MESADDRPRVADDVLSRLRAEKERHHSNESDHFLVDIARINKETLEFFADINNEALTQLDKGKWKNYFIDETELFAAAIDFALNPFPDVEQELMRRGIKRKVTVTDKEGKQTTEDTDIRIVVTPLLSFAKEWMRRRHPVNRLRVDEIIRLAGAAKPSTAIEPGRMGMVAATGTTEMRRGL